MVSHGKASPKAHSPTVLGRKTPLSNPSLSTDPPAPDRNRPVEEATSETREPQTIQHQVSGGLAPGVAPLTERQLNGATENIPEFNLQPSRVTSGIATPARNQIEEATESDILEYGSHPLSKPPSAARSLTKRTKKGTNAKTSSSIWAAIDDYSEDELSYL